MISSVSSQEDVITTSENASNNDRKNSSGKIKSIIIFGDPNSQQKQPQFAENQNSSIKGRAQDHNDSNNQSSKFNNIEMAESVLLPKTSNKQISPNETQKTNTPGIIDSFKVSSEVNPFAHPKDSNQDSNSDFRNQLNNDSSMNIRQLSQESEEKIIKAPNRCESIIIIQPQNKAPENLGDIYRVQSEIFSMTANNLSTRIQQSNENNEEKKNFSEESARDTATFPLNDSSLTKCSVFSFNAKENIFASRNSIKISEEDLLKFNEGEGGPGQIFNFYLSYLEEKTTKGLGLSKAFSFKAYGSDFCNSLINGKSSNVQKSQDLSQQPLVVQFTKIVFLVEHPKNEWHIIFYDKEQKDLNIIMSKKPKVENEIKIKILVSIEENDLLARIAEFLKEDLQNKGLETSEISEAFSISENPILNKSVCENTVDQRFYMIEMLRRLFYNQDLKMEFGSSDLKALKTKFGTFIKYFGDQTAGPLKYDHFL